VPFKVVKYKLVPYTAYKNVSYEVTEYQKEERQKQIPYTVTEATEARKRCKTEKGCCLS